MNVNLDRDKLVALIKSEEAELQKLEIFTKAKEQNVQRLKQILNAVNIISDSAEYINKFLS